METLSDVLDDDALRALAGDRAISGSLGMKD